MKNLFAAAVLFAAVAPALAHDGPRVFVANDQGVLRTYLGNNNEDSTSFVPTTIFTQEMVDEDGFPSFSVDFPGFQVNEQVGGIPSGQNYRFGFNIAGPLRYFDYDSTHHTGWFPTVADYFASATDVPQMAISPNSGIVGASTKITGDGPVSGFNFFVYNAPGDHGHVFFNLSADGHLSGNVITNPGGPDGVYALPLQLTSSAGLASPTFWILFGYQIAPTQLDDAYYSASTWGFDLGHNPAALPGDANGNGYIDSDDFALTDRGVNRLAPRWSDGDFNSDGIVNSADYLIVDASFAQQSGGLSAQLVAQRESQFGAAYVADLLAAVPEPSTAALLAMVAIAGAASRRGRRRPA